jgi:hypothetical protein
MIGQGICDLFTGDRLIEVTTWAGLTACIHCIIYNYDIQRRAKSIRSL